MTAPASRLEERVAETAREMRDELIALTSELVACVTTARVPEDPEARDEDKLQRVLGRRLEAIGADVDIWEPEDLPAGHPLFPELTFNGRPQLAAVIRGAGGGRSLLTNGHIDAVDAEPHQWTSDPYVVREQDGLLFGRGVVDMKGGIASALVACEALHRSGVRLAGDLIYTTNTDEESTGAGSWAVTQRGYRADGMICEEPTSFDAQVACRGMVKPRITVQGRPGHTQFAHPHWKDGGPVNAIEKAELVLHGIKQLRDEWAVRADLRHPLLIPGDIVPTLIQGGTWVVTYPSSCTICCDVQYLPQQGDADGSGASIRQEIMDCLNAVASADPWFREHPLQWEWGWGAAPAEMPADHPLVSTLLETGAELGRPGRIGGTGTWHDAANFVVHAGTPGLSYGPGDVLRAHTVDEFIPVDDMVDYAATLAVATMRFCGLS